MSSKSEVKRLKAQEAIRGPESEWRDYKCPDCDSMYFDIEIARAQERHDSREPCKGKLILLPSEETAKTQEVIDDVKESVSAFLNGSSQFSPSSNPDKPIGMDFSTAMQQVVEGKRVTRLEWGNPDTWLMMFMWTNINPKTPAGKYMTIHHADGAMHPLYINDGDLDGNDWVVVS